MADDGEIDIEGEFDFKLEVEDGFYDANELPSKSANLLPEFTSPPWMLEQGWTLDSYMDEKSKAAIERMLLEEQQYLNGRSKTKLLPGDKSPTTVSPGKSKSGASKRPWNEEEKQLFLRGLGLYGRSWTRISELIPTRTSLQVKNYAQQYFKNQAKKNDVPVTDLLTSDLISSDSLTSVLASVSTAQPTITSLGTSGKDTKRSVRGRQTNSKKKCARLETDELKISSNGLDVVMPSTNRIVGISGLDGVLPSASRIVGISGLQDIQCCSYSGTMDTSDLAPCVNLSGMGFLSGSRELGFDSSVSTLIHVASGLDTLAAVVENDLCSSDPQTFVAALSLASEAELQSSDLPQMSESHPGEGLPTEMSTSSVESEEDLDVDIDIENDDHEIPVLLGCSASPSSVYETLLRSANVTPAESSSDTDHSDSHETATTSPTLDSLEEVEETQSGAVEVGPKVTEPTDDSRSNEEWIDKDELPRVEEKVIVNGLTTALGEIIEFPIPTDERTLIPDEISEEEQRIHSEFFDGRQSKTPERYLKIRNHIIDCWRRCKPNFLNKTSVRSGLKNCGDVNCIGRIHCFLECTGVINFGCEQACYNNPGRTPSSVAKVKQAVSRDNWTTVTMDKVDTMRPRKRRIRDSSGHWVDIRELEGKTIEHKDILQEKKSPKLMKISYDPFQLIACQPFTEHRPAPFTVTIWNTAMTLMDLHAHVSRSEVIGLLGGRYDDGDDTLDICTAVPCHSLSTSMQCEMEPVSQTVASEQISEAGLTVVGWYHSHPTFAPNPSVRDIETQLKFQEWFAKGGSHFVGVIVSPYHKQNPEVVSEVTCLTIGEEVSPETRCNLPYAFNYTVKFVGDASDLLDTSLGLAQKYSTQANRVVLTREYRASLGISCLTKMLQSLGVHLLPPGDDSNGDSEADSVRRYRNTLQILQDTFTKLFNTDIDTVDIDDTGGWGQEVVLQGQDADIGEHISNIHMDGEDTFISALAHSQIKAV